MGKAAVHYIDNFFGVGQRWCAEIDMACGLYSLSGMKCNHKFTNHKSDVTCKKCLRAMEKK